MKLIISNMVKESSVTFHIRDSYKISQPKDTLSIASLMWSWAASNVPRELISFRPEPIAIDGYNPGFTGVINWYVPKGVDPNEYPLYIDQFIQEEASPHGIKMTYALDKSNMFNVYVWRIKVTKNDTGNIERLPELNVSVFNARKLVELLGLNDLYMEDIHGSIDAYDLLERIKIARVDHEINPIEEMPYEETGDKGAIFISGGLSKEQVDYYLNQLEIIARKAISMNSPIVEFA